MPIGRHAARIAVVGLLAAGLASPGTALAHSVVVSTDPADGATLAAPVQRMTVRFNEAPRSEFAYTRLVSGAGTVTTTTTVSGHDLVATVAAPLPDGAYTLSYRVASEDTHPVSGAVHFTVHRRATSTPAGAAGTSPTATGPTGAPGAVSTGIASSTPSTGTPSPTPTDDDSGPAAGDDAGDSDPSFWTMLFLGGLAAALAGWLLGRRARTRRR